MNHDGLTPTTRKMLHVLSDGYRHAAQDLFRCLPEQDGPLTNLSPHLAHIRRILRLKGEDVISIRENGTTYYQWRQLINRDG